MPLFFYFIVLYNILLVRYLLLLKITDYWNIVNMKSYAFLERVRRVNYSTKYHIQKNLQFLTKQSCLYYSFHLFLSINICGFHNFIHCFNIKMIIKAIFIDLFSFPEETFSYLPSNIWSISSQCYLKKTIRKQINLSEFQNSM